MFMIQVSLMFDINIIYHFKYLYLSFKINYYFYKKKMYFVQKRPKNDSVKFSKSDF